MTIPMLRTLGIAATSCLLSTGLTAVPAQPALPRPP